MRWKPSEALEQASGMKWHIFQRRVQTRLQRTGAGGGTGRQKGLEVSTAVLWRRNDAVLDQVGGQGECRPSERELQTGQDYDFSSTPTPAFSAGGQGKGQRVF